MANYEYDKHKLTEIMAEKNVLKFHLQKHFNYTNGTTIDRWVNGEDIYLSKLLELCNYMEISPMEFILIDGKPLSQINMTELPDELDLPSKKEYYTVAEMFDLKMQCNEQVFSLKEQYITELADQKVKLAQEFQEQISRERREMWREHKAELDEKDEEIAALQKALTDLRIQYAKENKVGRSYPKKDINNHLNEPQSPEYGKTESKWGKQQ